MAKRKIMEKETKKTFLIIGISAFVLIILSLLLVNYQLSTGKAYIVGKTPSLDKYDLTKEGGEVIITVLPEHEEDFDILVATQTHPYDFTVEEFSVDLVKSTNVTYKLIIRAGRTSTVVARDLLYVGGPDNTVVYLNEDDINPDLEVSMTERGIVLQNLHFLAPTKTNIQLQNEEGVPYLPIIRLDPANDAFTAVINATDLYLAPTDLKVSAGTVQITERDEEANQTLAAFNIAIPDESQALLLNITTSVQNRVTNKYYTLAIGNVLYALKDPEFPEMSIVQEGEETELRLALKATRDLQPFSPPCTLDNANIDALFSNSVVETMYSYNPDNTVRVWNKAAPDDADMTQFQPFKGYFVKLGELADDSVLSFTAACSVKTAEPIVGPPSPTSPSVRFSQGWNLISLPGAVPRSLIDFTPRRDFKIFECPIGYQCREISIDQPLIPGKSYWLFAAQSFDFRYELQEFE